MMEIKLNWEEKAKYYMESKEKFPVIDQFNGKQRKIGYRVALYIVDGQRIYKAWAPNGKEIGKAKYEAVCKRYCEEHANERND